MKLNRSKIISISALLIATAIAVVFLLPKLSPMNNQEEHASQDGVMGGSIAISNDGSKVYSDNDYGFSFFYPENFSVGAFSDEEGTKTILVQNAEEGVGVQIFISAFDEDIVLNADRIKKELPDIAMSDVKNIVLGGLASKYDVQAVSFKTGTAGADESREVWLVAKGNLYQISIPIQSEKLISDIITTWQWGN